MSRVLGLAGALLPAAALAGERTWEAATLSAANRPLTMMAVLVVLSLVPFAAVMLTSFSKVAVVLSIARSALGTQQAPPTLVLTGLAAVLTGAIMAPIGERMWNEGRSAHAQAGNAEQVLEAAGASLVPLREFLLKHGSPEQRAQFVALARELRAPEEAERVTEGDLWVIIPAFVVTELKEAFQLGFLVFLPFLVLDMVMANVLLALGMQTLSPGQVSLPFKILLFVAVDGWALLAQGLIQGYR